jgi:hypothetical protein
MLEGLDWAQLPQDSLVAGSCRDGNEQLVRIMKQQF